MIVGPLTGPGLRPLRDYQVEAADAIEAAWVAHMRTLLVLPTGMGKTRVISEVLRRRHVAGAGVALVLAHRKELLDQAARAIAEDAGLHCDVEQGDRKASLVGTLYNSLDVVVGSVQTLKGRRLDRWPRDLFKTVVIDEAHHAPAKSYRAILEHFQGAKVLGVTATPDRSDDVGLHNVFETCAYKYELRRAIREGWLCPIQQRQVYCADLDLANVRSVAGDLSAADLEEALTIKKVLHQIASPLVQRAGGRPTIVFTAGVQQAQALVEVIGGYTDRRVEMIHGGTPDDTRTEILGAYQRGEVQFLVNCAVLTEGFDAPHTSCIAIARPTKSRALYAQMLGRGTRLSPATGKEDCLVIDYVGNAGRHQLVTVFDVLAGSTVVSDKVRKEAQRRVEEEGEDAERALAKAQLGIAAAEQREARERESRRREDEARRRARVQVDVDHTWDEVDPFRSSQDGGETANQHLLGYLRSHFGVEFKRNPPSVAKAMQMVDELSKRQRAGLATYKQTIQLRRARLDPDLTKKEAGHAITALVKNGWKVEQWMREKWGPKPKPAPPPEPPPSPPRPAPEPW